MKYLSVFHFAVLAQRALALTISERAVDRLDNGMPSPPGGTSSETKVVAAAAPNPSEFTNNYCGSVNRATTTNPIRFITGSFQQPNCRVRSGQAFPQIIAPWVGIDGVTSKSAILQAGTVCVVEDASRPARHRIWFQWYPHPAIYVPEIPLAAGDWMEFNITATSSTAARIQISNLSQGITKPISATGNAFAGLDAVWVIERPDVGGGVLQPFPVYDDFWIQYAQAKRADGSSLGILGATQLQINGQCRSGEEGNDAVWMQLP